MYAFQERAGLGQGHCAPQKTVWICQLSLQDSSMQQAKVLHKELQWGLQQAINRRVVLLLLLLVVAVVVCAASGNNSKPIACPEEGRACIMIGTPCIILW